MLVDSGQNYAGRAYRDCIEEAQRRRVPIVIARRGLRWDIEPKLTLDVLAPTAEPLRDTGDDVNENSIVVRLTLQTATTPFRALFMGDAGENRETQLLRAGDDLGAAFLKVGHHGSRYASTPAFVAAVHPQVAIVSVGRHNTFGHPASETLATLSATGATIFRTDRCGAVTLRADGTVSTMLPTCDSSNRTP